MTHRKLAATAAATLAITGTLVAATTATTPARAAAACTPSWHLQAAPPAPGSDMMNPGPVPGGQDAAPDAAVIQLVSYNSIDSISAISPDDAVLTGADHYPAAAPWTLRWDGHSLATQTQQGQPAAPAGASRSSFDSDTDGWEIGNAAAARGPASAPLVERWHGGRWTVMPTAVVDVGTDGTSVQFSAVKAISPDNAWLIGLEALPDLTSAGTLIEHWDGTQWSVLANPASGRAHARLNALTVVAQGDIWAVGQQNDDNGNLVPFALHWNGTSWQEARLPAGGTGGGTLAAVSAAGPNDVWAVGSQPLQAGSSLAAPFAEHWDGAAWTVASLPDTGNGLLTGVYAAGPGDVWTVGTFAQGLPSAFLHLDGKTWTTVPTPGPAEYGVYYQSGPMSGTGPDDVWVTESAINLGDDTQTALVAHLGCAEGS